nr:peptidase C39 family protein [Pseudomonas massiliensis]
MAALHPQRPIAQGEEIQTWREAATVFITARHGGCRLDGMRNSNEKAVMRRVEAGSALGPLHCFTHWRRNGQQPGLVPDSFFYASFTPGRRFAIVPLRPSLEQWCHTSSVSRRDT